MADDPLRTHDLVKLYKVIEEKGFRLDTRSQAMIVHLNHHYCQDLGTKTRLKVRYPTEKSESKGGAIPLHSDMVAISDALIEQAANRIPENLNGLFRTIPTYRTNLARLV